jgi:hypothetical protein
MMDWAARFIDSIYNQIGSNTYVNEMLHSAPTVMGKRTVEAVAEALGMKPVYDEIRKTVRFV